MMQIFKQHWLFLLIVSLVLILLQYTPYLYHLSQTPADRVYLGAERYPPDYYVYLFYLNQGAMGRTSVVDFYTNQPHNGSLVHIEYLIAGKLGNLLGLSLPVTFYLFRSLTFLIYVLVSFWFIGLFFKEELLHKLTFLLSWFWGGIFWPQFSSSVLSLKSYFDFYQPPDLINRLTFEPHKFLGMSLFLVILYLFSSFWLVQNPSGKDSGVASLPRMTFFFCLFLLAGFLHGVTALSLIFTLFFFIFFRSLIKPSLKTLISLKSLILLLFLLALPLLYWQFVFSQNPVWYAVSLWERHFVQVDFLAPLLPTLIGFMIVLGPLILLGSIGLSKFLKEQKNFGLLLLSFLTSNAFLFFLGYIFLGTSKHRFWQTPYLVGWSILAMYGLQVIFSQKKFLLLASYFLLLLFGLPNFKQGLNRELFQFKQAANLDYFAYPLKLWYQGLIWAKTNTDSQSIFLSLPNAGHIIPAIPGRRVFLGDFFHTPGYYDKLPLVEKFYRGQLTDVQAKNFLKQEKVNYVFWGFEEKAQGNLNSYSNFLTPIFDNGEVTIFKIPNTPQG